MTIQQQIVQAAIAQGVDPNLALAIAQNESNFNPGAISSAGAVGVMQLMPSTAMDLGVTNINDVQQNINGGVAYLAQLLAQFGGDIGLTAAAYNAGPNGDFSQPGVTNYANNVLGTYQSLTNSNADYVNGAPASAISIDPSQQDIGVLVGLGIAAIALVAFAGVGVPKYEVWTLDTYGKPYEKIRTDLSLKDAQEVVKVSPRVLGKKAKVVKQNPVGISAKAERAYEDILASGSRYGKRAKSVAAATVRKMIKERKLNPDEVESIAKGFHGRAIAERFEIEEEELYSDSFAVLGCLVELNITRDGGKTAIPIKGFKTPLDPKYKRGDEVYVAAPDRNNIEFVGGDQKIVNADKLAHVSNKNLICLGQVESIVYLADKHHLVGSSGKEEEYEHEFGKKRWFLFGKKGGRPDLMYDCLNEQLKLVGGTYTVTDEGIKD